QHIDRFERFLYRRLRRMLVVAQSVQEQDIEPGQLFPALRWNVAVIGQISAIAKAKSVRQALAMRQADRLKRDSGHTDLLVVEDMRNQARAARFRRRRVEHVPEGALNHIPSLGRSINRNLPFLHEVEGPYVIQS